jgi:hypothetical protein
MIESCEMFWRKQALSGSANAHIIFCTLFVLIGQLLIRNIARTLSPPRLQSHLDQAPIG